jgi:SAM-dependent methyltransferase
MLATVKGLLRAFAKDTMEIGSRLRQQQTPAEIFGAIYREKQWGGEEHDFYSGSGSHTAHVIEPYVAAVRACLSALPTPPVVVDLGCGDFAAAGRLADLARQYHACDVVPELIARNRGLVTGPHICFHLLDAITDPLPSGDVVIVKQVFQHLSNEHIAAIVRKLSPYPLWIITEHVPRGRFVANRDFRPGGMTRLLVNSGIVLTEEPFRIRPAAADVLCDVLEDGDPIRTIAYRF